MNILGKEISNKTILIVSGVLLAGLGGYIYMRKVKGKKIYDELMGRLSGSNVKDLQIGQSTDKLTGKSVMWTSPAYSSSSKMKYADADIIATNIAKAMGLKGLLGKTNGSNILPAVKSIKNQADAALILTRRFTEVIKRPFLFNLKTFKADIQSDVTKYLNNLPLK